MDDKVNRQAQGVARDASWPALPLAEWQDTYATLHMWTQIVGKVRLARAPMLNHWWQVPLYVTARGLTTSPIPYGDVSFEISFDFLDHQLRIQTSDGAVRTLALAPRSVADFYREFMAALRALGLEIKIWTMPVEVLDPIPFDQDDKHHSYVPEQAQRFWRILKQADRVLQQFRCGFTRQMQPGAFFLGQLRPGGHALLRPDGAAAPGRHPAHGGLGHAAGVLA